MTDFSMSNTGAPVAAGTKLTGNMGMISLMLTVLAYSAPMAVVTGFVPFVIIFGGPGATMAYAVTTVVLLLFSIGYIAMTKQLKKPGAFYTFITAGLGRNVGLGSAYLATSSYLINLAGAYGFMGVSVAALAAGFGVTDVPWYAWAFLGWILVSALGHFHIELSAKILTWVMVLEVGLIVIYNVAVFYTGGAEGHMAEPWTLTALMEGNTAVALLFCVMVFIGFEATALFRDEVRNPEKTIPMATYGAVIFIGILYTVTCYTLYIAYGSEAVAVANANPIGMFPESLGKLLGPMFVHATYAIVVTSEIASLISIHNVASRYIHNLSTSGAAPAYFSSVHPQHKSPYRASLAAAVIVIVILAPFVILQVDGTTLYSRVIGIAAVGILALMSLVSVATAVWFWKNNRPNGIGLFRAYVAPLTAAAVLGSITLFAAVRFDLVVGGDPGQNTALLMVVAVSFIFGLCLAHWFKARRPDIYRTLGFGSET